VDEGKRRKKKKKNETYLYGVPRCTVTLLRPYTYHNREHSDVTLGIQVSVLTFLFSYNSDIVLRTHIGSVVPKLRDFKRSLHEVST
jgi:hypothetical protein